MANPTKPSDPVKPGTPATKPGAQPAAAGPAGKSVTKTPPPPGTGKANTKGPDGANVEELEEEEEYGSNFWQQKWVQNVLPFCTSLALHAGIIILGIVTYKAVEQVVKKVQEQMTVNQADLADGDGEPGGIPHPGLGGDPTRDARQNIDESVPQDSTGIAEKKGVQNLEYEGAAGQAANTIGLGVGSAIGGRGTGTGTGTGSGGPTGDLAPFGMPGGGGGIGPKSNFMGSGGRAMKVAFVCDASGSMLGQQFDMLKEEINAAVGRLSPRQAFDIIFFKNAGCDALTLKTNNSKLLVATPDNKQKTINFLHDEETGPDSDPIAALRHAFRMQPQLIYLLTDGAFSDNAAVRAECNKLNVGKKVRINTIAFIRTNIEPSDKKLCEEVLNAIAKENSGTFTERTTEELLRQGK